MKTYEELIQGTDEWFAVRLGKVTASNFGKVMAKGQGKTRKGYLIQLASERLTGEVEEGYTNGYMENGSEMEAEAREYYCKLKNCEVEQVGFVELNEDVGCSPDGLVGDGLVEIKCPKATTHIETIARGTMQPVYKPQVQGQLWVMDKQWCDWVSYNPKIKDYPMFVVRVERDEEYIANLEVEVGKFVTDLKEFVEMIKAKSF